MAGGRVEKPVGEYHHFRNDGLKLDDRFWPDARYSWPAVTADLIGLVGGLPEGQGYLSLQQVQTGEMRGRRRRWLAQVKHFPLVHIRGCTSGAG